MIKVKEIRLFIYDFISLLLVLFLILIPVVFLNVYFSFKINLFTVMCLIIVLFATVPVFFRVSKDFLCLVVDCVFKLIKEDDFKIVDVRLYKQSPFSRITGIRITDTPIEVRYLIEATKNGEKYYFVSSIADSLEKNEVRRFFYGSCSKVLFKSVVK